MVSIQIRNRLVVFVRCQGGGIGNWLVGRICGGCGVGWGEIGITGRSGATWRKRGRANRRGGGIAGDLDRNPEEIVVHFDADVPGRTGVEVELGAAVSEGGEENAELEPGVGAAGGEGGLA